MKRAAAIAACLALAGCGSEGIEIEGDGETESPAGFQQYISPDGGTVTFPFPTNWAAITRQPPGAITIASGGASVTLWVYTQNAIKGGVEQARRRLVDSLQRRDPGFEPSSDKVTRISGLPAVEIRGSTEISGRPVEVRSVHIYGPAGEYVFDALAEPADFARADAEVFEPLLDGLKIKG